MSDLMSIDNIEKALHKADLAMRPYIIYIHPEDAETLAEAFPNIDKDFLIQLTPFMERGNCIIAKREELELSEDDWNQFQKRCIEPIIGKLEEERNGN